MATNRFRTVLALMGITIGVGSVIAIVGLGDGAKVVVRDAISSFGAGSLMVMPNWRAVDADGERYESELITIEDVEQINAQADAVAGGDAGGDDQRVFRSARRPQHR